MAEQQTENAGGKTENQSGAQQTADSQETKNGKSENNQSENNKIENNQAGNQTIKQTGTEIIGQVREKATGVLDEQKANITSGLTSVADSLRQVGDNLRGADEQNAVGKFTAQYGDEIARRIESVSDYLDNADLKDITRDVERLARRQPALFVGGAFVLGLLAVRFLKSSSPKQISKNRGRGSQTGNHTNGENSSNRQTISGNA